jgi:hypothetical protein
MGERKVVLRTRGIILEASGKVCLSPSGSHFLFLIFIFSRGIHWHVSKVLLLTVLYVLIV